MATRTPWGMSDSQTVKTRGIIFYGTPSHGGFHVCHSLNGLIPEYMRRESGWYEEDCDWAIVAVSFSQLFDEKELELARQTLRSYEPEAYEKFYNVVLKPGESYAKDQKQFHLDHANDYLALAAWRVPYKGIPEGTVGVFAGRGGRLTNGRYPEDTAHFFVPAKEYDSRGNFPFVIDESRHLRVPAWE